MVIKKKYIVCLLIGNICQNRQKKKDCLIKEVKLEVHCNIF